MDEEKNTINIVEYSMASLELALNNLNNTIDNENLSDEITEEIFKKLKSYYYMLENYVFDIKL